MSTLIILKNMQSKPQKIKFQILCGMFTMENHRKKKIVMPFSMLLNLVGSSNANNKEILWKFINSFTKKLKPKDHPIFDGLTEYAINYFKDKVEPNKKFKKANSQEKKSTRKFDKRVKKC